MRLGQHTPSRLGAILYPKKRFICGLAATAAVACALPVLWRTCQRLAPVVYVRSQEATQHSVAPVVAPPAPPSPRRIDSSASPVPLPLILTATRPGRSPRDGSADIGIDAKTPQTYMAGAILANGSRLGEIYADSVVLTKDGRALRLYLTRSSPGPMQTRRLQPLATVGGTAPPARAIADSSEPVLDYIRATPLYDGSSLRGYQVYAGSDSLIFARMGLQPGDVITAIDGARAGDPETVIPQLRTLADGGALTVTVERKSGDTTLVLDGRVIADAIEQKDRDAMVIAASNSSQ